MRKAERYRFVPFGSVLAAGGFTLTAFFRRVLAGSIVLHGEMGTIAPAIICDNKELESG